MSQDLWSAVDSYLVAAQVESDAALEQALAASSAAGLPAINVAPNQGKLLHLLARLTGARKILEIGTLGGYSAIWLARALPADGRLTTLEADPKHAEVARANLQRAGLGELVDLRLGRALETLPRLAEEKRGPFDLVFIDADKENIPEYFGWALELARRGSLIIVDNVVRKGAVLDGNSSDPSVRGVRRLSRLHEIAKREGMASNGLHYLDTFLMGAIDAALAAQNTLVAAESLGLGTVYIGALRNRPDAVKKELGLPPNVFPLFGMCVGRPDPARPSAVKPRLAQRAVLFREQYDSRGHEREVADYDAIMQSFYTAQGLDNPRWSRHSAERVRAADSLRGRDRLRQALHTFGFQLR